MNPSGLSGSAPGGSQLARVWQIVSAVLYFSIEIAHRDGMMANWITLSRLPLLIGIVLLLYLGNPTLRLVAAALVVVLIFMDSLDGFVARRRKESGVLGSKLDIAVDRVVELVLWVVYAHLGLISVAIPIIVIIRGTMVDAVRSFSLVWGETSFGMMQTKVGRWLVGGSVMRTSYGVAKALAFCTLALAYALRDLWAGTDQASQAEGVLVFAVTMSWIATTFCIVRGAPVLFEARTLLRDLDGQIAQQTKEE
jgi:CDP-diacylglycerol--glycerol-3-phosphate 3-phosphatidyltransferase